MGTGTLVDHLPGEIIEAADPNDIHAALKVDFVGRDTSGAATPGQRLGTPLIPWGTAYVEGLVIDGQPVDPGEITAAPNRVISGAVRSTSEFPDYLRCEPIGGLLQFTVLGATTPLEYDVNGVITTITTDIVKTGITPAPSTNRDCLINDSSLIGQDESRFLGENGTFITVDNMQSEWSARVGQFAAFLNLSTQEMIYGRIASTTRLDHCRRGFFFDDNGDPIPAAPLNNNDTLRLSQIIFIFAEDDGTTIDVTYSNPIISGDEPGSPATGDYWYDLDVNVWKRYNGSIFEEIDRTFIGYAVSGTLDVRAARPEIFGQSYKAKNSLTVRLEDVDTVTSEKPDFIVSVHGRDKRFDFGFFQWAASADFESGFTRTADRYYWLYMTEEGKPIISGYKPYDSLGFQRGWYHPYESWRAVGQVYNNASNEFELVNASGDGLWKVTGDIIVGLYQNGALSVEGGFASTSEGRIILTDKSAEYVAPGFSKNLSTNWSIGTSNGGNPGLTIAANTTYYCFALTNDNGTIFDVGIDNNIAATNLLAYAPVVAAGFTKVAYQGALLTDAVAAFRRLLKLPGSREFLLLDPFLFASGGFAASQTPFPASGILGPSGILAFLKISYWVTWNTGTTLQWNLTSLVQTFFNETPLTGAGQDAKTVDLFAAGGLLQLLRGGGGGAILNSNFFLQSWRDDNLLC